MNITDERTLHNNVKQIASNINKLDEKYDKDMKEISESNEKQISDVEAEQNGDGGVAVATESGDNTQPSAEQADEREEEDKKQSNGNANADLGNANDEMNHDNVTLFLYKKDGEYKLTENEDNITEVNRVSHRITNW